MALIDTLSSLLTNRFFIIQGLSERKKQKWKRLQLRSMDCCRERPFSHQAVDHLSVTITLSLLYESNEKQNA